MARARRSLADAVEDSLKRLAGAEIICLPIMGDHRGSTSWSGRPHDFDIERWHLIQRV